MTIKELRERISSNPNYEYIPIPKEVTKIIVRRKKDKILLAHFVLNKNEKTILLHYVKDQGGYLSQHGGYCNNSYTDVKTALIQMAEAIAMDWPEYAVNHLKK